MFVQVLIVILLVSLAGTFAGLTLALFSIRLSALERKVRLGNPHALKVYKIRKQGNRLLCALLLGNVASYTLMTIFLDHLTTGLIAGFIATALIFVFGEIVPQAVFPRYALIIGARLDWLVWALIYLSYPISAPLAWILDKWLGEEPPVLWSKEELGEIIRYHEDVGDGIIDEDEERIILGALSFSDLKVTDIMIPRSGVFFLPPDERIHPETLELIKSKGFSRIPVVEPSTWKIHGMLYTKSLIGVGPGHTAGSLCHRAGLISVRENLRLDSLLNLLLNRRNHMALVVDDQGLFNGVVTLEDIMEEILKLEIDEKRQVSVEQMDRGVA